MNNPFVIDYDDTYLMVLEAPDFQGSFDGWYNNFCNVCRNNLILGIGIGVGATITGVVAYKKLKDKKH